MAVAEFNVGRPLIRLRVTQARREFANENLGLQTKDAADTTELKNQQNRQQQVGPNRERRVMEIGLQAARRMVTFSSQTYYNQMVNASCQYDTNDFYLKNAISKDNNINLKLEKFLDKVSYDIESALSSNEIINVFQDDFQMLGDEEAAVGAQSSTASLIEAPRRFSDQSYVKDMSVSCIKFSPHNPHHVGFSLVKNLDFASRSEIMGTSFDAHILIVDFSDV